MNSTAITTVTTTYSTSTVKRGRKHKAYITTWGETIPGLSRRPDGRWRNTLTGKAFREPDERLAVARFRQSIAGHGTIRVTASVVDALPDLNIPSVAGTGEQQGRNGLAISRAADDMGGDDVDLHTYLNMEDMRKSEISFEAASAVLWPWLRKQLIERPEWVAQRVGIPQISSLADMPLPRPSVLLTDLLTAYMDHAEVARERKARVKAEWERFVKITGAASVRDLSTEALLTYKDETIGNPAFKPETIKQYFSRVTTVIGFGMSRGMNAQELKACLDRCAVLTAPKSDSELKANPISRENFHKLLAVANPMMKAALLLSLNAALYGGELLLIEWADLDLTAGVYNDTRRKTGMRRAATLWTETVEALKAIKTNDNQPLFPSRVGTSYSVSGFRGLFNELKEQAGVGVEVKFNNLRDGAFTSACAAGVQLQVVQLLAGHKLAGQTDHYLARNPKMVQPACDAVHAAYME